jgi:hypothetical protein
MPFFAIQRFRPIGCHFHVANAFRRLGLGQVILFGPTEEATECSQSPVNGCWSGWRGLRLEILAILAYTDWCDFTDSERLKIFDVPGDKMANVRQIGARCVATGIVGMKGLFECFYKHIVITNEIDHEERILLQGE